MSEWKEYKIGDIGTVKGGKRLPKGKMLVTTRTNHPYIRIRDLNQIKVLELNNEFEYVDDDTQKEISRYIVDEGDVLLSIVGTIGLVNIVGKTLNKANLTENCVRITNLKEIYNDYLYYYLVSTKGQNEIKRGTVGAVQPKLPIYNIQDITIYAPELASQQRIASILSSLDDKIAVNKKICENLEAQAQALFKHWFVDFAPFKDGKFVESELGLIPEGWKVGTLGDIAELRKPSIKPQDNILYTHYSIPAFDNSKKPSVDEGSTIKSNKFGINDGAVLLSKLNPSTKRIWYTGNVPEHSVSSTEFLPFYSINKEFTPFIYCYLNCDRNYREIANGAKGTTNSHQRIDANSILSRGLAYSEEAIRCFCVCTQSLMELILEANQESLRLATLRDTLLPKLMSGQIKV